jgi:hypothetical protein
MALHMERESSTKIGMLVFRAEAYDGIQKLSAREGGCNGESTYSRAGNEQVER